MTNFPKLRNGLEALPVEQAGQRLILFRDRLGYSKDPLIVSETAAALMLHMNGESSLRDLQALHMRMTGTLLYMEDIEGLVEKLDEHLFLETERFIDMAAREVSRFQQDPVRRMQFAGKSYPVEPDALRRQLDGYFAPEAGGPGIPTKGVVHRSLVGLVAPHIDLDAGGTCFAHAYKASVEAVAPATWVILGTGHEPVENYFALVCKDFETPLGSVRCDTDCCDSLIGSVPRDLLASEYNHHREHSIEFQAVFLAHLHPGAAIVPMLCSFSPEDWESDRTYIDRVAAALRDLGSNSRRPIGYIASVDLAHIGPRYGDRFRPREATVLQHLAADRELLECLERCDPEGFMRKIHREQNRRRVCGMAPLYMLTRILEGRTEGKVHCHSHAVVDQENSFVTFAGMSFYETPVRDPALSAGSPERITGEA
jgi:MEMO1 family protein